MGKDGKWNKLRTNIFFLIYKYYIDNCRLRKELPTKINFERKLKNETRKILLANPTNEGLVENLIPIWTGRDFHINLELNDVRNNVKMTQNLMKPLLKVCKPAIQ